jgi:transposase
LPSENGGLQVDAATIALLEGWVNSSSQARLKRRSRIILLLARGLSQAAVAGQLGVSRRTVAIWKQRFLEGGATTLQRDRPGRGRPKGRSADAVAAIAAAMATPPAGQDRWTARALAKHVGVSHSTVLRVWRDSQA